MNVTCPQCSTVYRLPDEKAKAGAKLRCSICRCVFTLPENDELLKLSAERPTDSLALVDDIPASMADVQNKKQLNDAAQNLALDDYPSADAHHGATNESCGMNTPYQGYADSAQFTEPSTSQDDLEALDLPEKKKTPLEGAFGLLLCIAIILGGIWAWKHTPYLDGLKALIMPAVPVETALEAPQSLIEKLEIISHQSYQVKNEKLGTLTVIEGRIRNNFTESRELIRLEAELLDREGKVLSTQTQIAGVSLNSFQLEVLDKEELEKALKNRLDIISANINVLPGSEVPFTVVFTDIPAGAIEYKVRIVEASATKRPGNLTE